MPNICLLVLHPSRLNLAVWAVQRVGRLRRVLSDIRSCWSGRRCQIPRGHDYIEAVCSVDCGACGHTDFLCGFPKAKPDDTITLT